MSRGLQSNNWPFRVKYTDLAHANTKPRDCCFDRTMAVFFPEFRDDPDDHAAVKQRRTTKGPTPLCLLPPRLQLPAFYSEYFFEVA